MNKDEIDGTGGSRVAEQIFEIVMRLRIVVGLTISDENYFHETEERTITWKLTEGRLRTSHNDPG